jgi:hypothetical protein
MQRSTILWTSSADWGIDVAPGNTDKRVRAFTPNILLEAKEET